MNVTGVCYRERGTGGSISRSVTLDYHQVFPWKTLLIFLSRSPFHWIRHISFQACISSLSSPSQPDGTKGFLLANSGGILEDDDWTELVPYHTFTTLKMIELRRRFIAESRSLYSWRKRHFLLSANGSHRKLCYNPRLRKKP